MQDFSIGLIPTPATYDRKRVVPNLRKGIVRTTQAHVPCLPPIVENRARVC